MATLSTLLHGLAQISLPRLVFAMRPQDPVPDWITHVIDLNANYRIAYQGENRGLLAKMGRLHTVGMMLLKSPINRWFTNPAW